MRESQKIRPFWFLKLFIAQNISEHPFTLIKCCIQKPQNTKNSLQSTHDKYKETKYSRYFPQFELLTLKNNIGNASDYYYSYISIFLFDVGTISRSNENSFLPGVFFQCYHDLCILESFSLLTAKNHKSKKLSIHLQPF